MSKIDHPLTNIRGVVFDVDGVLSPSLVPMSDDGVPHQTATQKELADEMGITLAEVKAKVDPVKFCL